MYIGIDIGGTKCAIVLGDEKCNILQKIKFETKTKDETINRILVETEKLVSKNVKAIGISCGGPLDGKKGVVISPMSLS